MINNTFLDETTQIPFWIAHEKQLEPSEAAIVVRHVITKQKEMLYDAWKSEKQNKDWAGDVEGKKTELFLEHNRAKAPVFVFGCSIEAILKADSQTSG